MGAESLLARLGERGIEYVLGNSGTDFAPIIEAHARAAGRRLPKPMVVPHENVAMAMAHGYFRTSGKPMAVMVHVNVGTANTICGLINASRDNVPILLAAGKTPNSEYGHFASRNRSIHWGQDTFDQGGMVREYVKWDYELREGQSSAALADRAIDIMMSEPRGPVYLTLPREVLSNASVPQLRAASRAMGAVPAEPAASAIDEVAALIAGAELPLIVTSTVGRDPHAVGLLARLAEDFAIPVVQSQPRDHNISSQHSMNVGFDPDPWISKADVILVVDCVLPWIPGGKRPRSDARIVNISPQPMLDRYPFKEVEADLLVAGNSAAGLRMLTEALTARPAADADVVERRRALVRGAREEAAAARVRLIDKVKGDEAVHLAYLAHCLNLTKREDAIIVSELGVPQAGLDLTRPRSFMGNLISGGLGFGLGAALGAKLAAPGRQVITTVGDGSYIFGNPLAYHFVGRAEALPTLTIIANNGMWGAVRKATLDVFPDGSAAKANTMAFTELQPSPDYEKTIETCGGLGMKVEHGRDLLPALERALESVDAGTPVTMNVRTQSR